MVVDSSAIIAIARLESEATAFSEILAGTAGKLIAAPTYLECACVLRKLAPNVGSAFLGDLIGDTLTAIVPFGEHELTYALDAQRRYGRGSGHAAKLNFGDCFAYALAKSRNLPLLFKGEDFSHTDIVSALKA